MIRNKRGAYKNMATENGVNNTSCTIHDYNTKNNFHRTSKLLTFHPALYTVT
jgi:hypothetical protein